MHTVGIYVGDVSVCTDCGLKDFSPIFDQSSRNTFINCNRSEEDCLFRVCGEIRDRLDIIGITLGYCRDEFDHLIGDVYGADFNEVMGVMESLGTEYGHRISMGFILLEEYDYWARLLKAVIERNNDGMAEVFGLDNVFEKLDDFVKVRMFCEPMRNRAAVLRWNVYDLEKDGSTVTMAGVRPANKVTLVTEGSFDTAVLKRSMECYRPWILDLFSFVDMKDGYPFGGTGKMSNLFTGLVRLEIINRILFVFDNDAEGNSVKSRLDREPCLENIRLCTLPDLEDLRSCRVVCNGAESETDVNGIGVSIECFLDLSFFPEGPLFDLKEHKGSERG